MVAIIVLILVGAAISGGDDGGTAVGGCETPTQAWIGTLQDAIFQNCRDADISDSAYLTAETPEGEAYYVAIRADGLEGVAVFGTSETPLQADPGLIAAANFAAHQLSDLRTAAAPDSLADRLLRDVDATYQAEQCLS